MESSRSERGKRWRKKKPRRETGLTDNDDGLTGCADEREKRSSWASCRERPRWLACRSRNWSKDPPEWARRRPSVPYPYIRYVYRTNTICGKYRMYSMSTPYPWGRGPLPNVSVAAAKACIYLYMCSCMSVMASWQAGWLSTLQSVCYTPYAIRITNKLPTQQPRRVLFQISILYNFKSTHD